MIDYFSKSSSSEPLDQRILDAIKAGLEAGGEAGLIRSAALLLVDKTPWPPADLRVDWTADNEPNPIETLQKLWEI